VCKMLRFTVVLIIRHGFGRNTADQRIISGVVTLKINEQPATTK
jgi:hypothetical protein